jgi:CheY-like chemotaxis protein
MISDDPRTQPKTILIVDDDHDVQETMATMVAHLGHLAVCALDTSDALRRIAVDSSIEILITDIAMPVIHGFELARRARALRRDLKVLYVTGYSSLIPDRTGETFGTIVLKPFTPTQLAAHLFAVFA